MRRHDQAGGFTLIELMIVVAIVGTLAAIAIPSFLQFQLRSKTAEGAMNLAAIRAAEETYRAAADVYVAAAVLPRADAALGGTTAPWPAIAPGFDQLGFSPEGEVRFNYTVVTGANMFLATAKSDLDDDNNTRIFDVGQSTNGVPPGGCGGPGQVALCTPNNVY
ncbi:MAG: prepilin-type N-terminal cleavage/methylation domain-containing protein [Deltaproteobacteria bacterium]|nr:prepilin-type N-terminal cleavage/methylation domain-containing protein [Deltaproteobacteria bacterium]